MIPVLWELLQYSLNDLNIDIIWSYQNAARINKPYVMINYTTVDVPDHDFYGKIDENGIRTNSGWRKAIVELQFYCAQESYAKATRTAMLLATERSLDKQCQLDVSIGMRLFLQRVPALLNNSQYEDRAIYQFEFFYTEHILDDTGLIETVIVDGDYTGALTPIHCHEVITKDDNLVIWDDTDVLWDDNTVVWEDHA